MSQLREPGCPQAVPSHHKPLAQFLSCTKKQYLHDVYEDKALGWTVVMGNESGDLDTIASSIAYSWIQTEVHKRPTVALIQTHRADLGLRPENLHALSLAGLQGSFEELFCISDLQKRIPFPSNKFALVDHNRILPKFTVNNLSQVVAVIDHHEDEGLYKNSANPRKIVPAGSCASLIALLCPDLKLPMELATLLLCAILIDTNGLKVGGKATQIDREAAMILLPRSILAPDLPTLLLATTAEHNPSMASQLHTIQSIRLLADDLSIKKETLTELGTLDLLRRDYKQYMFTLPTGITIKAGLSTVLRDLDACDDLLVLSRRWMASKGLTVFGVLTSYRDMHKRNKNGKGTHCREMLWLVRESTDVCHEKLEGLDAEEEGEWAEPEGLDVNELASRLWAGLERSNELNLETHESFTADDKIWTRAYKQGNANATRKVTAPLLKAILEDASH